MHNFLILITKGDRESDDPYHSLLNDLLPNTYPKQETKGFACWQCPAPPNTISRLEIDSAHHKMIISWFGRIRTWRRCPKVMIWRIWEQMHFPNQIPNQEKFRESNRCNISSNIKDPALSPLIASWTERDLIAFLLSATIKCDAVLQFSFHVAIDLPKI